MSTIVQKVYIPEYLNPSALDQKGSAISMACSKVLSTVLSDQSSYSACSSATKIIFRLPQVHFSTRDSFLELKAQATLGAAATYAAFPQQFMSSLFTRIRCIVGSGSVVVFDTSSHDVISNIMRNAQSVNSVAYNLSQTPTNDGHTNSLAARKAGSIINLKYLWDMLPDGFLFDTFVPGAYLPQIQLEFWANDSAALILSDAGVPTYTITQPQIKLQTYASLPSEWEANLKMHIDKGLPIFYKAWTQNQQTVSSLGQQYFTVPFKGRATRAIVAVLQNTARLTDYTADYKSASYEGNVTGRVECLQAQLQINSLRLPIEPYTKGLISAGDFGWEMLNAAITGLGREFPEQYGARMFLSGGDSVTAQNWCPAAIENASFFLYFDLTQDDSKEGADVSGGLNLAGANNVQLMLNLGGTLTSAMTLQIYALESRILLCRNGSADVIY